MALSLKRSLFGAALAGLLATPALSSELVINTDTSDPAPKAAFQALIDGFKAENPDIEVEWNVFDHEGYKTAIRNFLTAEPPDIVSWYAGNRMAPYVEAGLLADVTDVWTENNLDEELRSAAPSMTIEGKKWGVPYTYYQWGVYYRKDLFEQVGAEVPKTWQELLEVAEKLEAAGIEPFTIGTKFLWTAGGWFDYLNLRVNGYDFHMDLTSGKVPYTDPRVIAVFDKWSELVEPGYFIDNHAAYSWQEALSFMVQGKAAMYLMGNFAVAPLREAGLDDSKLGFFQFPQIDESVPMAEDAPTDTLHIAAGAENMENAKKFLAYLARPEVQTEINKTLGQLPVNKNSEVEDDQFLTAGFEMLSNAEGLAQFYDRDAPAQMAKAGMEGFQEFMVKPDRRDAILERLERVRQQINAN